MISSNERWVLEQASTEAGFMPHTQAGAQLAMNLEYRDLCRQCGSHPIWKITNKGKDELRSVQMQAFNHGGMLDKGDKK